MLQWKAEKAKLDTLKKSIGSYNELFKAQGLDGIIY
jgi:hypothetical protein